MKLNVYNKELQKIKEIEINPGIFGVKPKTEVIHQVVVAQQANARQILAYAKDRSEVRGGGRKPWRQKGTGRARHGSSRSPIWIGGGVTFGPTKNRNFAKSVNKKQKQLAMAMCVSDKVSNEALVVIDKIELSGKTKELAGWLKNIQSKIKGLKKIKKVLLILDKNDKKVMAAAMNMDKVNTILADSLNCMALLSVDAIVASEKAIKIMESHYKTRIK